MAVACAGSGEQPRYRARPGAGGALYAQVRSGLHGVDTGAPGEIAERNRRDRSPREIAERNRQSRHVACVQASAASAVTEMLRAVSHREGLGPRGSLHAEDQVAHWYDER